MKPLIAFIAILSVVVASTHGDETYPPPKFKRVESKWSAAGHLLLVHYVKPPGDFTCESQIWLESSQPESKPQHLFTYANRASPYIDDAGDHIAIMHHEDSADNLLYLFVRGSDGLFHQVQQEIRAAAFQEFSRQTHIQNTHADFDHFDCCADKWLEGGLLRGYTQADSLRIGKSFHLKPWYFIYDADHQKFVAHDFPENKDAFVNDQR